MVTITYGTAYCTVTANTSSEERLVQHSLDNAMAVRVPGYFFTPAYQRGVWDGFEHFFSIRTNKFATGLLPRILKVLKSIEAEYEVVGFPESWPGWEDIHEIILQGPNGDFPLWDFQVHTVRQILKFHRGIVKIATNGGKTEVWAGLMKVLGSPPSVFFVPRVEIFKQTINRFEERLGHSVGYVGQGKWEHNPDGITVVLYHTLAKKLKDKSVKKWLGSVSAVCADECQALAADGYRESFDLTGGDFRVGMSGTPFNESKPIQRARLVGATGAVLADVSNQELIEKGHSQRPNILVVNVRTLANERDYLKVADYRDAITYNTNRNKVIGIFSKAFEELGMQTVVFVSRTQHGKEIQAWTPESWLVTASTRNRVEARNKLERGDVFTCICTSIFDTGLSVDHIQGMVNASEGQSEQTLLQRVGRTLRKKYEKNLWIVDFRDEHNPDTKRHAKNRMETYKDEKAFNIVTDWRKAPLTDRARYELIGLLY